MVTKQQQLAKLVEIGDDEVERIFIPLIINVLTAHQLSKLLGYTVATIKHLAASPKKNASKIPPPIKNHRGENVWEVDTVAAWLQARNEMSRTPALRAEGEQ